MHPLTRVRIEKKLTQHQLAKALGFSSGQSVSDIERGKLELSDRRIKLLSKRFGKDTARRIALLKVKGYKKFLFSEIGVS